MKVILLKDTPKVGQAGDVVTVADGYAMNVLFPQKRAEMATPEKLGKMKAQQAAQLKVDTARISKVVAALTALDTLPIIVKATDEGSLFEKVTEHKILTALDMRGIDTQDITMRIDEPFKKTGTFQIPVIVGTWKGTLQVEISGGR